MATPSNEVPKFVARYIENFIDLVENVPNDLSRRISRLHELQLEYESILEKLETSLTRFCRNGKVAATSAQASATTSDSNGLTSATANDLKQLKYLLATQNYLARMSELSDNKLAVMQDALDQLDTKSRELDHDFKLINTALSDGSEPNTSTYGGGGGGGSSSGTTNNKGTRSNGSNKNQASTSAFVSSRDRDKSRERDSSPEPTYCICNQVSYGDMICCDNRECEIEWFHFQCVSLTSKPKGKWYCPNCRGDRSNQPKK